MTKKAYINPFGGRCPPPSVLKSFLWGLLKKKSGLVFLLGFLKDTYIQNISRGNLHVGVKLIYVKFIDFNVFFWKFNEISCIN